MIKNKRRQKQLHILYEKYEFIAEIYAKQMFNESSIGYDKDDMLQEFRSKLFSTIISYALQFGKFKRGERRRPMVLEPYLRLAMRNHKADFIKKTKQKKYNGWDKFLSVERDSFDHSNGKEIRSDITRIVNFKIKDYDNEPIEINGIDLLQGIGDKTERMAFIMYLKGYTMRDIDSKLSLKSGKVIRPQIEKLKEEHSDALFDFKKQGMIVFNSNTE